MSDIWERKAKSREKDGQTSSAIISWCSGGDSQQLANRPAPLAKVPLNSSGEAERHDGTTVPVRL